MKISDEAVQAGAEAIELACTVSTEEMARVSIAAALPYLLPVDVAAVREECAQIADNYSLNGTLSAPVAIASAIRALSAELAQGAYGLGWVVRERRGSDGELLDCFVEAPRCEEMPYALEVLGDDYTGYGDVEAKLEHCKLIVAWANASPTAEAGK